MDGNFRICNRTFVSLQGRKRRTGVRMALPAKIILTTSFRSDFLYMSAFVRYNEKIIDNSE